MKVLKFAVMLLMLLLAAGCVSPAEITVDESADGTQVTLEPGRELVVRLESNSTTGYSWTVAGVDSAVLQQVGEAEYEAADTSGELVGSGGWESFRFEAIAAGQTTVELIYHQPWEEDVAPVETFTVDVVVRQEE